MKKILKKIFYTICIIGDYFLCDNKARILMYHSHLIPEAFFNVSPENFNWQLDYLIKQHYQIISLSNLYNKIVNKESLKKCIVITYDDGHKDFTTVALPEFQKRNIPVSLFWPKKMENNELVTSHHVRCPLLNQAEINVLKQNTIIDIGSHGMTHRELNTISDLELEQELVRSDEKFLAYPRGKFGDREKSTSQRMGYYGALTTQEGAVSQNSDKYALPRISINQETDQLVFRAKLSTLFRVYKNIFS